MLALQQTVCWRGWGTGVQYFVELQTPIQVECPYHARQTTQVLSIPVPDHLVEVEQLMVGGIMLVFEAALDSEWLDVMGRVPVACNIPALYTSFARSFCPTSLRTFTTSSQEATRLASINRSTTLEIRACRSCSGCLASISSRSIFLIVNWFATGLIVLQERSLNFNISRSCLGFAPFSRVGVAALAISLFTGMQCGGWFSAGKVEDYIKNKMQTLDTYEILCACAICAEGDARASMCTKPKIYHNYTKLYDSRETHGKQ